MSVLSKALIIALPLVPAILRKRGRTVGADLIAGKYIAAGQR